MKVIVIVTVEMFYWETSVRKNASEFYISLGGAVLGWISDDITVTEGEMICITCPL